MRLKALHASAERLTAHPLPMRRLSIVLYCGETNRKRQHGRMK